MTRCFEYPDIETNVIKTFSASLTLRANKLARFSIKPLQHNLMFGSKVQAYPSGVPPYGQALDFALKL